MTEFSNQTNAKSDPVQKIILGSRSPRRKDLLASIVGSDRLLVLPPASPHEAGFSDVTDHSNIASRLTEVVRQKHMDVCEQMQNAQQDWGASTFVVVADTIVIITDSENNPKVLGQPGPDDWQNDVRTWFRHWLSGHTHEVWTGVRISQNLQYREFIVRTRVTFCTVGEQLLEWYISTEESRGKAGGYAIQGYAAAFVTQLHGSLTNVIGLPVIEVLDELITLGWIQE